MLSRRNFLNTTLGASAGLIVPTRGLQRAAAQPARRMIADAQVHLWKAESPDWRWVPGLKPQLPEPMTIERLVPMMDEAGVDRVVVVPPSWPGDRNDYALEAARRYPDRFAVMGRIPLQDPQSAALLPRWKEQPGMLGVRITFLRGAAPWVRDGTADWFWPAAEKTGLPVMFLAPGQMPAFIPIAERHPQLTLIIDHMNLSVDIAKVGKVAEAIEQTVALAKYQNVSVKLSSAPTYSLETYPFHDMKEHLKRCFDAFGAALPLGHRHDELVRQGHLPPTHHPFHRGAGLPVGGGQGLGHGARNFGPPGVGVRLGLI
jgi:predicted TIM-barrel fold metal-dependent hydrolase